MNRRPFLAVEKGPDDAPILLGERTLGEIGIDIALRTRDVGGNQWRFSLPKDDDNTRCTIKIESAKTFRKRLRKGPKVYALVEHNPLLQGQRTKGKNELPSVLKEYVDVFSP